MHLCISRDCDPSTLASILFSSAGRMSHPRTVSGDKQDSRGIGYKHATIKKKMVAQMSFYIKQMIK